MTDFDYERWWGLHLRNAKKRSTLCARADRIRRWSGIPGQSGHNRRFQSAGSFTSATDKYSSSIRGTRRTARAQLGTGRADHRKAISMTLQDIIIDIHALREDMEAYERKFGVLSETFYEMYTSGDEPKDDAWVLDWADWAGVYKIFLRRQEALHNL